MFFLCVMQTYEIYISINMFSLLDFNAMVFFFFTPTMKSIHWHEQENSLHGFFSFRNMAVMESSGHLATWISRSRITATCGEPTLLARDPQRSHAEKGYYQYQRFMGRVEFLQNLIHDGVGQVGHYGQLHLPEPKREGLKTMPVDQIHFLATRAYPHSRALLISSDALSMRALRMEERGIETCSEMDERGGLSLSAAEQDMGHSSWHRDTMESTTTWEQIGHTSVPGWPLYGFYWHHRPRSF